MALIKCPECRGNFSDTAPACPHCGYQKDTVQYGQQLGSGIKNGLKGLNTVASPKHRETCINLCLIPIAGFVFITIFYSLFKADFIIMIGMIPCFMFGACNFYVGNFKKGIIYTVTCGLFLVGILSDLFRLTVTKTFKDANGFPVIY